MEEKENFVALGVTWFGILTGVILTARYVPGLLGLVVSVVWYLLCVWVYKNLLKGKSDG